MLRMSNDEAITTLLRVLDAIANAPMTAQERELRARPAMADAGTTPRAVLDALQRENLGWNLDKASEFGVSVKTWVRALKAVETDATESVGGLLFLLHRAEAAAAMMRAGYRPATDISGRLTWSRG
jgi:hypothetical protein